jgi:hypothetical protein
VNNPAWPQPDPIATYRFDADLRVYPCDIATYRHWLETRIFPLADDEKCLVIEQKKVVKNGQTWELQIDFKGFLPVSDVDEQGRPRVWLFTATELEDRDIEPEILWDPLYQEFGDYSDAQKYLAQIEQRILEGATLLY